MSDATKRRWWVRFTPLAMLHRDRLRRARIRLAREQQGTSGELHDPIEDDPQIKSTLAEADALAEAKAPDSGMGWCYTFWATKQRILRKHFNIEWFSPADMNPGTFYD